MLWLREILTPSTIQMLGLIGGFVFFLQGFIFMGRSAVKPETVGIFGLVFKIFKLLLALLSLWLTIQVGWQAWSAIGLK